MRVGAAGDRPAGLTPRRKRSKQILPAFLFVIETICGLGGFLAEGSVLVAVAIKASHWSERNATSSPGGPVGEARAC